MRRRFLATSPVLFLLLASLSPAVCAEVTRTLRVEVPANTHATVRLPTAQIGTVTEGGQPLTAVKGVSAKQDGDTVVVDVGSGAYRFAYPMGDAK